MIDRIQLKSKGQGTVEFALILGVLLVFIFTIIESGRLFQGWLTVQNSARAGGRYALTGNSETECLYDFPACLDPRVHYIKDESKRTAAGLSIDPEAIVGDPGSFSTEVWSTDDNDVWIPDYAGGSGDTVQVKVTYDMPIIIPLFWVIADSVPLVGQVTVTTEKYDQISTSRTYSSPRDAGQGGSSEDPPQADLEIMKNASPTVVYSGHELSYTITVQNNGPFDAEDVVVIDQLPATTTYLGASVPGGGYCDPPQGIILTCYLPNLAGDGGPNSSVSFVIYTLAPTSAPMDPTIVTNVASVSNGPATTDPYLGNNNTSVSAEVIPWADLSVSKSDNPDPVRISQPLAYTISVLNRELNEAHDVYMQDELPPEVSFVSALPDGLCSYDGPSHMVTCGPVPQLDPGSSFDFTINVTAPPETDFISNYAHAWADEDDPDPLNNETTESTMVTPAQTDLELFKEGVPYYHYAGESLTFHIDVVNNGPDDAPVTWIEDSIPAGFTIITTTTSQGICSLTGNDVSCDLGPIPSSGSAQVTIEVSSTLDMVVDNDDTPIMNTAEVFWGSNQTDPNPASNSDTSLNYVSPWVDLSIIKTAPPEVYDGDLITYTLEVHNDGPFIAENVEIWDSFPWPEGDTDGRYGSPECDTINNSYAHCEIGDLAIGATYVVTVVAAADWPGDSWNVAEVYAEEDDPYNPGDNEDDALTVILPRTELEVIKHAPATVYREYPFYYGLEVWNHGPSYAYGVQITDTLPVTVTYQYVYPSDLCSYDPLDHEINCTFDIRRGERRWVWIRVSPDIEGTIVNNVKIAAQDYDSDLVNNMDVVTSTVAPSADLSITKTGPSYVENITSRIDYDIEVTNNGPSIATNITIVDTFPLDILGNPPPSYCDMSGNTITCTLLNPLLPGESFDFGLKGKSTDTGYHTNLVSVSATEHDPDWDNNTDSTTAFVNAPTDISIDKQGPDTSYTGEVLPYALAVYNDGDYTAHGVKITDTLPLTVTFHSADPGCTYNSRPTHSVTCDISAIASKTTATVNISVIPNEKGWISNVAVVDALETDPNTDNNKDTVRTYIDPAANLALVKTAPEYTSIFDTLPYTLTINNGGPYTATDVVVTDTLPVSVTFVSASTGCVQDLGTTILCNVAEISPQSSAVITMWVTPFEIGEVINGATTSANEWDPDTANNTDTAVTSITQADLQITKTASSPAHIGEDLVYTMTVRNEGPSTAHSVVITDTLPAAAIYASDDSGCSYNAAGHRVTCDLPDIPDQGSATLHITIVPSQTGTIENVATVLAHEFDPNLLDNTDTVTSTVLASADLTLTKTAPVTVTVGDQFEYQLVVFNNGPSDAATITVTDTLPDEVIYIGDDSGCSHVSGMITCTSAILTAGEAFTFTIQVEAIQFGTAFNTAGVISSVFDTAPENNSDSATTSITEADLSILKSGPASVTVFEEFDFNLAVTNDGPSDATGVVITDTLPAGLEYVSSDPLCSQPTAQIIVCTLGNVNAGATVPITITVKSIQAGLVLNLAKVEGEQHDPDTSNNEDDHPVDVTQSDLRIVKTSSPAYLSVPFIYTLEIFNDGPSTAIGVIVTDTLPTGVGYSSDNAGCSYDGSTHSLVCSSLPPIPFPGSISVEIVVIPSAVGEITNAAEVTSSMYDPDLSNNTVSINTTVGATADLEISVSGPAAFPKASWFTVTLTVDNNGPSDATGVIVTNTIEIVHGQDLLRTSHPGCTVIDAGMVICSITAISSGASETIDIGVYRKSKADYTNTAWVDGIEFDPIPANNSDFIVIDVQ